MPQPPLSKSYSQRFQSSAPPLPAISAPTFPLLYRNPFFSFYGVDVSQPTSADAFACLKGQNLRYAVVRCYESLGRPDPNCAQTVRNAHAGGMEQVRPRAATSLPALPPPPDHGHRWTFTCFPAPNVALPPRKSNHCSIIGWPTVSMSRFCGWTLKAPTIGWAMRTAIGCTPLFHFLAPIRSRLINIAQAWYAQLFDACASMKLNFGVYGATRFQ